MKDIILEIEHIEKSFGDTQVLKGINLSIEKGEFITLLGASGCGKTTTLRIISGLETPDKGSIKLNGIDVTKDEPNKRNVNTVFQNYALFPHMNVETNIAYSLKLKKVEKNQIKQRVAEALQLVQLIGFEKRMPSELSGGQKQRVAIARAIVNNPDILLLDEPLGALDLQLRRQMQIELKNLQKELGITFIYITHDQEEAINMSDRIVVMKDGRFEQVGTPHEVYDLPKTSYVARFVGTANIIRGQIETMEKETITVHMKSGNVQVKRTDSPLQIHDEVTIAIRSENINLIEENDGEKIQIVEGKVSKDEEPLGLTGIVKEKNFAAGLLRINVELIDGKEITASRHGIDSTLEVGDRVRVSWKPETYVLVDMVDKYTKNSNSSILQNTLEPSLISMSPDVTDGTKSTKCSLTDIPAIDDGKE
ncbi:ABC transporter ATP-binding protein [Anaeromicropila herbilytica]|uniref:Spermidine/putrescine import ATP-binding protein PotA n=1 Tax=Anaeromicropila herbilytica TaxID=2785025 RepID=A0A7R7EMI7_9FIRM|nr:ABC transporter ATP-binding protein [Anaeromicropila herbilytica]BCN31262.1 spermidine/putrescine import ATP-binding protein PotA [Anaeromicropila herbilytica]